MTRSATKQNWLMAASSVPPCELLLAKQVLDKKLGLVKTEKQGLDLEPQGQQGFALVFVRRPLARTPNPKGGPQGEGGQAKPGREGGAPGDPNPNPEPPQATPPGNPRREPKGGSPEATPGPGTGAQGDPDPRGGGQQKGNMQG